MLRISFLSLRCVNHQRKEQEITQWTVQFQPDKPEEPELDARMTTEQVKELGEALSILSAKSSVLKERNDLRALMEENLQAEEV